MTVVTVPNVLATRYASAELAAIWSPEHKVVLERQLWIAVLRAQRDLGIDVPDGVVEAYQDVLEKVDRHAKQVAKIFVDLFLEEIWKPFQKAGMPAELFVTTSDRSVFQYLLGPITAFTNRAMRET